MTDHLDLWTSALLVKSTAGRGSNGRLEAYGIKKLRELILELAVRGQLVPQDASEEPANVLLENIAIERDRQIKEVGGKIKAGRKVGNDEIPYQLPPGWEWVRLGSYVYLEMGQSPSSNFYNQEEDGLPFFQGKADFGKIYPTPRYWCTKPQKYSYPGDVLLSVRAPVGPTNISSIKCCIGRGLAALRPMADASTRFLLILMRAFERKLASFATGTTFGAISRSDIESLVVSVPPLSEQRRVVAKVDELMALCDELEQQQGRGIEAHQTLVETLLGTLTKVESAQEFVAAWGRIAEHFDTLFTTEHSIDQLKQAILRLAVTGKLVQQDPADEPADELYTRIQKTKEGLLKKGAIKRAKIESLSSVDELHQLPAGWIWAQLGSVFDVRDGTHDTPKYTDKGFPLITSKNIYTGKLLFDDVKFISEKDHRQICERSRVDRGDILFAMIGSIGNPVIVDTDKEFSIKNVALFKYYAASDSVPLFLLLYLNLVAEEMRGKAAGGVQSFVSLGFLRGYPFPLPPIAEQRRIVGKVDELMGLCDTLKARLAEAQTTQIRLTDAIVEQAVAAPEAVEAV